jgi:hypothetical protein
MAEEKYIDGEFLSQNRAQTCRESPHTFGSDKRQNIDHGEEF